MKHPLFLFLFLGTFAFVLNSCSLEEQVEAETPLPQLAQQNGGAIYCRECPNGCLMGYAFTTANVDGNHPQGGYKIAAVVGDCECVYENGKYYSQTTGSVTTHIGQIGGPGSGSLPDPAYYAQQLWGFGCGGGGIAGGIGTGIKVTESWSDYVVQVNDYTGTDIPGLVDWPNSWNVHVHLPHSEGDVLVELGADQAVQLEEVRLHAPFNPDPIATLVGNGDAEYLLDLSELPTGGYLIEMHFSPGFSLYTPIYRYIAE